MKKLFVAAMLCAGFASCTQVAGWFGSEDSTTAKAPVDSSFRTSYLRDESITAANAYSDLFLDSAVLDSFIVKEKINDSTAQSLRNFYRVRNYQYAWFNTQGLTEQGRGFWGLHGSEEEKDPDSLRAKMDTLIQKDSLHIQPGDSAFAHTELRISQAFVDYAKNNREGLIQAANLYFVVPAKKMAPMELADSILHKQRDSAFYSANASYAALKKGLALYFAAAKNGGWPALTKGLKKGTTSTAVAALKKRLAATGDYPAGDSSQVFSDTLLSAIKDYQARNGLAPTGLVNDSLIASLNVPAEQRVEQILVNLNRILWMQPIEDSTRIVVNIPSFTLYAFADSGQVLQMPIAAGKEGSSTVLFTDQINQVVFAPYWRLPQSIVQNEIMPKMKTDPAYLKKKSMEVYGQYNDSVPQIRQLPGKDNALGRVKFLFPNSFDIYLHDTPDKSVFARQNRAVSHGCIRVADPVRLAQFLLEGQSDWTPEKIEQAMAGKQEQTVAVKRKVPVQINYYTAWTDEQGKLHFRNDAYGHDSSTRQRMFSTAATAATPVAAPRP